ncbi:hypothetical protein NP493_182g03039 [Ridgeia piscesae]|uniref:Uncharacterized protein n=1 Tax=Ridgeia piscesae TaxID=27915 RepID=A0AAD9P2G9_RIDPI|nr:hypothetical protein NP493_182g03039 [Ridgeia piscesae]
MQVIHSSTRCRLSRGRISCITGIDCIADGIHSTRWCDRKCRSHAGGDVTWSRFEAMFTCSRSKVNTLFNHRPTHCSCEHTHNCTKRQRSEVVHVCFLYKATSL